MRSVDDVARFQVEAVESLGPGAQAEYYTACFEAGIPKAFWGVKGDDVRHNVGAFKKYILNYCSRRKVAQKHGYSLLLMGDNGCGKTMFLSFVLTQMLKRGCSAYYTTLGQLDVDIKRGFKDPAAEKRLDYLLSSDFVAIDELGKEHFKSDSYLNTRLELLLKTRYDDGEPVLMATNLDYMSLVDMYGPSLASMWDGKYTKVALEPGDFREKAARRMKEDLGF